MLPLLVWGQQPLISTLDPYPSQTSLLVKTRSNWFNKDNSSNNYAVTTNGNVRPATRSPFSVDGSVLFDGSSDFLNFTNQTFTGNFTVECWYYQTANSTNYSILFGGANVGVSASNTQFYVNNTGGISWVDNAAVKISPVGTANKNTWNHIAFVRSGSTTYIFLNGTQVGTATNSASIQIDRIGDVGSVGAGYSPNGYICNARISDIARYTTTFTPSTTPFVADANTILLTCQSPYTQNNNTFLDHSSNDFVIARNGNVAQGTFSPYIGSGGSGYFDGSADAINLTATGLNALNTFTFECWVYMYNSSSASYGCALFSLGNISGYYQLIARDNTVFINGTTGSSSAYTQTITNNAWHHLAWVNNAGSNSIYWDGTRIGTWSQNYNGIAANNTLYIGSNFNLNTNGLYGFLSNYRISSTARYSGTSFTLPTGTFVADANTFLLWKGENFAVYDGARKNNIETLGAIVNSSSQTRFTFPTVYTDGSGSYAQIPTTSNFDVGSSPFSISGWFYLPALPSAYKRLVSCINPSTAASNTFLIEIDNANRLVGGFEHSGGYAVITHTTTLTTGWHYFNLNRNGTTLSLAIDGSNQNATVSANAASYSSSNTVFVSRWYNSGTARDFPGNTFDITIRKGVNMPVTFVPLRPSSEF